MGERIGPWLARFPRENVELAVVEVPLLFESEMEPVSTQPSPSSASDEVRRARAEARGHALVGEREARQLAQDEKAARAEHVIENDGTLDELEQAPVRARREAEGMSTGRKRLWERRRRRLAMVPRCLPPVSSPVCCWELWGHWNAGSRS